MIKKAHFIWFQGPPPQQYLPTIHKFKKLNPDFDIYVWNEQKLLELLNSFPLFKISIEKAPYMIQKIDIYKYIILYLYGGIYMDLDIDIIRPFDSDFYSMISVGSKDAVFSYMNVYSAIPFCVINNGIIIANVQNSSLFLDIIKNIPWDKMWKKNKDWAILETTGPFFLTKTLKKDNRVLLLDQKYLEGCPLIPWLGPKQGIYITHLHHSNWMEGWLYLWMFLLKYIVGLIILALYIYLK